MRSSALWRVPSVTHKLMFTIAVVILVLLTTASECTAARTASAATTGDSEVLHQYKTQQTKGGDDDKEEMWGGVAVDDGGVAKTVTSKRNIRTHDHVNALTRYVGQRYDTSSSSLIDQGSGGTHSGSSVSTTHKTGLDKLSCSSSSDSEGQNNVVKHSAVGKFVLYGENKKFVSGERKDADKHESRQSIYDDYDNRNYDGQKRRTIFLQTGAEAWRERLQRFKNWMSRGAMFGDLYRYIHGWWYGANKARKPLYSVMNIIDGALAEKEWHKLSIGRDVIAQVIDSTGCYQVPDECPVGDIMGFVRHWNTARAMDNTSLSEMKQILLVTSDATDATTSIQAPFPLQAYTVELAWRSLTDTIPVDLKDKDDAISVEVKLTKAKYVLELTCHEKLHMMAHQLSTDAEIKRLTDVLTTATDNKHDRSCRILSNMFKSGWTLGTTARAVDSYIKIVEEHHSVLESQRAKVEQIITKKATECMEEMFSDKWSVCDINIDKPSEALVTAKTSMYDLVV
eukprot:GHVQ01033533.1.p1 GENE.GHVQ01033533.1~~GHVQ01033533.1.p1  ORF type:complete len:511 (+),score=85.54 GHVQ01033533.1:295-1827(+)